MFYSMNIGPIHLVSFSSEFYYFVEYGWTQIVEQYRWLEKDLAEANKPENRAARPWIITMCHRPLYCSNSNDPEHCPNKENIIRVGIPEIHAFGIEDLLYKYGVDVHFQAHEHSYERMWPVYNDTVCNGSYNEPYRNPRAPVHIVTGSAGCQEGVDPFERIPYPWSAFQSDDYGYTRMKVFNATHLYMEQVSDDQNGKVIDYFTIIKDKHGAGLYDCHKSS
jgi:acid phosphatase type 7